MIIGISGKIGSGKDTIGSIIQYLTDENVKGMSFEDWYASNVYSVYQVTGKWKVKKFAGKLKLIGSVLTGVPIENFEDQEFKKQEMPKEWDVYVTMSKTSNLELRVNNYPSTFLIKEEAEKVAKEFGLRVVLKKMTYREFLQKLGTDAMRDELHTNVWVNALFADYKPFCDCADTFILNGICERNCYPKPNWIITDMRFPDELEAIKKRGGISIRVNRNKYPKGIYKITDTLYTGAEGAKLFEDALKKEAGISEHPSETALDNAEFDYIVDNNGSIEDLVKKVKEILIKENII